MPAMVIFWAGQSGAAGPAVAAPPKGRQNPPLPDRLYDDLTWQGAGREYHPNDLLGMFARAAVVRAAGREVPIAAHLASSTQANDTIRAGDAPGIAVT